MRIKVNLAFVFVNIALTISLLLAFDSVSLAQNDKKGDKTIFEP